MTITPCGSQVHWSLYSPHTYVQHPANVHPNSAHFNNLLHVRIPPLVEVTQELKEELTLLGGQSDEKRMNYFNQQIDAGLFFYFAHKKCRLLFFGVFFSSEILFKNPTGLNPNKDAKKLIVLCFLDF